MSTAVIAVTPTSIEFGLEIAKSYAALFLITTLNGHSDLWIAEPDLWIAEPDLWIAEPAEPKSHKTLELSTSPHSRSSDALTPLVEEARLATTDALSIEDRDEGIRAERLWNRRVARLGVGALALLAMKDRAPDPMPSLPAELVPKLAEQHPTSFGWLAKASRCERSTLMSLTVEFGRGLDWRSWDPSIFGEVYGNALVGDDRRQLGIHYAPPRLAARWTICQSN
jgi:hypothetical protein